jgi:hypothetical protein
MEDFKKLMIDSETINKEEENNLGTTKIVNSDYLKSFVNAYNYDAASTINWLVSKLKLIKSIIENGHPVTIQESSIKVLNTLDDLKVWIKNTFDQDIVNDVFE